jgi:hypothetical protein
MSITPHIMKTSEDKLIEKLVDTIMKDSVLEKPSFDFTTKVMSQVLTTNTSKVYVYKPLISKYVFFLIFGCFITLFFYLEPQTNNSIYGLSHKIFYNINTKALFSFSKVTFYSVVLATLMLFIQISLLKKHFENQLRK